MTHTEIEITAELVRDLLHGRHPDLADRPLRLGARGWDNQQWRLGDDLAVRVALGDAVRGRPAAQGAHLAALPRPAPSSAGPRPAATRRTLGAVSAALDRHHLVPGPPADRAPAMRTAEAADALAAFLRGPSSACPRLSADRPRPRRAADRPCRAVRPAAGRGHRAGDDPRPGRRPRRLGGRRRRARLDRSGAVASRRPASGRRPHSRRHLLRMIDFGDSARATRPVIPPPRGYCCRTAPPNASTVPTGRPRTPPPCAAPAVGRCCEPSAASSSERPASTAASAASPPGARLHTLR